MLVGSDQNELCGKVTGIKITNQQNKCPLQWVVSTLLNVCRFRLVPGDKARGSTLQMALDADCDLWELRELAEQALRQGVQTDP